VLSCRSSKFSSLGASLVSQRST